MADWKDLILNTPDTTSDYSADDISGNKVMGVLAYLGILVLIPIIGAKESKFARFHANQGLVLLLAGIIAGVASWLLGYIPILGSIIGTVIDIVLFAYMILGIINVVNGKAKELPFIGKFKLLK